MIMVHCGCSYTSSPIHTVEIVLTVDMHTIKHNHSMLEEKNHKKQPQQQKQEKNPVNTNF